MDKAILSTLEDGALRATVEGAKDGKEFGWSRDAVKKEEVSMAGRWNGFTASCHTFLNLL